MNEQILILRTTLEGLRGMACVEACAGSKVWRSAVETIDRILEETYPGYTEAEIEKLMMQETDRLNNGETLDQFADRIIEDTTPTPEGFTEFSNYETSFAKVKRIMKEAQND